MRSLGDKISSTIVAQHAKVPCMAWSGTGITDTKLSEQGYVEVPEDAYMKACVTSPEQGLERAKEIGFPVMIKASEGGGGKGIRKVDGEEAFAQSFRAVEGEVPGEHALSLRKVCVFSGHGFLLLCDCQALPSSS